MKTQAHVRVVSLAILLIIAVYVGIFIIRPQQIKQSWESGATTVTLRGRTLKISGKGPMEHNWPIGERPPWFYYESSITNVVIAKDVTYIEIEAFVGCTTSLTSIRVAANNAHYSSEDGVLFNKSKTALIAYPPGRPGAYTIPYGVTSIEKDAFALSVHLTSVIIPSSVTSIGEYAFALSWHLTSVTIPSSVTSIGKFAFTHTGLTSVTIPSSVTSIEEGTFLGCTGLTSITIPSSVTSIGDAAFAHCTGMMSITVVADNPRYSSVDGVLFDRFKIDLITYPAGRLGAYTIPDLVLSIKRGAFSNSLGLTSVTIPSSVRRIEALAFAYCTSLTSFTIPSGVRSIEELTFTGAGLTSVTIPSSVSSIGFEAFKNCTNLTSVINLSPRPLRSVGYEVFHGIPSSACLYVPASSIDDYRRTSVWEDFECIKAIKDDS